MASTQVSVRRIAPLSAFKITLGLCLAGLAAWVLCVVLIFYGLQAAGVWEKLNSIIGGAGGNEVITFGLVLSVLGGVGAIVALVVTILSPLAAVIYNATVSLFGGLEVKLTEERD